MKSAQKPGLCCKWFHLPFVESDRVGPGERWEGEMSHFRRTLIRILRFCVRQCPFFMTGIRACDGLLCVALPQCLCSVHTRVGHTCKTPTHKTFSLINKMYYTECVHCTRNDAISTQSLYHTATQYQK